MRAVVDATREYVLREHPRLISVKLEPRLPRTPDAMGMLADAGLTQAEDVQLHTHTVVIDLERSEEEILASFSKTARKLIRRAERDGFTIERVEGDEALFDLAWQRMQTIRGGQGLTGMRGEDYYKTIWRAFTARGQADWWLGHDGGDGPQTVTFTIPFGRTVIDKDGGRHSTGRTYERHSCCAPGRSSRSWLGAKSTMSPNCCLKRASPAIQWSGSSFAHVGGAPIMSMPVKPRSR